MKQGDRRKECKWIRKKSIKRMKFEEKFQDKFIKNKIKWKKDVKKKWKINKQEKAKKWMK